MDRSSALGQDADCSIRKPLRLQRGAAWRYRVRVGRPARALGLEGKEVVEVSELTFLGGELVCDFTRGGAEALDIGENLRPLAPQYVDVRQSGLRCYMKLRAWILRHPHVVCQDVSYRWMHARGGTLSTGYPHCLTRALGRTLTVRSNQLETVVDGRSDMIREMRDA